MVTRKVSKKDEHGRLVSVSVRLSEDEIQIEQTRAANNRRDATARAVVTAIERTAMDYAGNLFSGLADYDELRLLSVVAAMFRAPAAVLSAHATRATDIYAYAESRKAWARHPARTTVQLGEYDPTLDRNFPS